MSFYKFINKDIKELNGIILSLFSVLFLVGVGLISYTLTNNSYALFGDSIVGKKQLEFLLLQQKLFILIITVMLEVYL